MIKRLRRAFRLARLANQGGHCGDSQFDRSPGLSRRRFLQTGAAVIGSAALAGCGTDSSIGGPGFRGGARPFSGRRAAQQMLQRLGAAAGR